jgi:hypothetical protein
MPVCTIAVEALLAPPVRLVMIRDGLKLRRRSPPTHPVKSGRIHHQPVNLSLKVLLLGQVEALRSLGVHTLLQHPSVVVGDSLEAGVLESVLDHFSGSVVEDQAGRVWVNTVLQTKMVLHKRETIKFAQLKKK